MESVGVVCGKCGGGVYGECRCGVWRVLGRSVCRV